ncbi:MAG: alanine racemase [Synergistaceae bacterium]|jgi:predicted amino acid racemase|nr:alanine racemase [Synergistaceae bacterium]
MTYPILDVNMETIRSNARIIMELCGEHGIEPAAVIKGFNAMPRIMDVIVGEGYKCLASSRIPHLRAIREAGYPVLTMGLRIPMRSEAEDVVRYCDISLESELETINLLNGEAERRKVVHKIILMRDLGDLREGIIESERFVDTACLVEKNLPNIELLGVGSNLSCYGSVRPTAKNLSVLAGDAVEIERLIGRRLDVVSGGASTSIPLLVRGEMPRGINHLRVGGALMHRVEIFGLRDDELPGLSDDTFILRAEIIEIGEKPTYPIGELAVDCFGNAGSYEDRGLRRRALLAVGAFDIASFEKISPLDSGARILGCSSDHMIVDIHDSDRLYRLGGTMEFRLRYQSMLWATANGMIEKNYRAS